MHGIEQHHRDVDHREDRIQDHRQGRAGEEATDLLQFVQAAADLTDRAVGEIAQGQPQQVIDDRRPQADIDSIGGVGEEIGAQGREHRLGQSHGHEQRAQHVQGADVALADHRIDDLLNQQRIEQAKELHKKAGDQHLHQHALVLLQGRQEPSQTKTLFGGLVAALNAENRKVALLIAPLQGTDRHGALARCRITDQDLPGHVAGPDHHRTTAAHHQGGELQARDLGVIHAQLRGPQPHQIGNGRQLQ